MKKRAIAGQVVIMLFFLIVIIFIILLGISSTQSIQSSVKDVTYLQFKDSFIGYLETMSYLEVKEIVLDLEDVSQVCFINKSPSSPVGYKENIMKTYYESENSKNLLLFEGDKLVDAIALPHYVINENETGGNPNYLCFDNIMGKLYLKVRNYNKYYMIKKEN